MNTAIDLRVAMIKVLPDELQEVVWRKYYSDSVIPWLMMNIDLKLHNSDYEELFTKYHDYVVDIARRLCTLYQQNQLWFNMNMDFTEDRLMDIIFTTEGCEMFDMYQTIRENITHSYLLRLGLIDMVDRLRARGRNKVHACLLCNMMIQRLKAMIIPIPDAIMEDAQGE
jgi:hypothetical protein